MAEQGAENRVAFGLSGEFLDNLGPALGIGAVVLEQDFYRPAVDAARIVDNLERP